MNKNENKYALILGGSSGLGLATAKRMATAGYNLIVVHRDRKDSLEHLSELVTEFKENKVDITFINKDALKKDTIDHVVDLIPDGALALLVHSIAKGSLKGMTDASNTLTRTDLDITLHAMATSWWEWVTSLIEKKKFASKARNIAFTSEGNTKVWQGYGAVSAAKATLEALMRQMAVELAPLGITTNCIQAGVTQTTSFKMIPGSEKLAHLATKRNPFLRLTQPEDIANVVWLLCRIEADWINGTIIKADGGESLR